MGQLTTDAVTSAASTSRQRFRALQVLGILSGIAAGAWLGAAEVPTKLVSSGLSPFLISLMMVFGVFLGRWTVPVLVRGTRGIGADLRNAPHLVIWAVIAGCLWSVANTLTVFAIRDLGLSIAFPLWNTNALIGIGWGVLLFHELKSAGWVRWTSVGTGALLMFLGGMILARLSSSQISPAAATKGIVAALGAGVLWGTMYIPYRKAYLSGMNPLSFVSFFTVGELGMMIGLALHYSRGSLWREISGARHLLFWLLAAGFVWVIGDILQQYAVKYVGISRGIPLSNSNQLWGLIWGAVAFGEFRTWSPGAATYAIYGSLLMALGLVAISFSVADEAEQKKWREAADRERARYALDEQFVASAREGRSNTPLPARRWFDWVILVCATAAFVWTGAIAEWPSLRLNWTAVYVLLAVAGALFVASVVALWKITRFN
jgi:drug/metabolite transporter (DMT)-like permease